MRVFISYCEPWHLLSQQQSDACSPPPPQLQALGVNEPVRSKHSTWTSEQGRED